MKKQKPLHAGPYSFDVELKAIEAQVEEAFDIVDGKIGETVLVEHISPIHAEKIGKWFLQYARWSKERG